MTVEAWDADMAALLDPDQELETIEVGDRVAWDFTMMHGVTIYGREEDRIRSCVLMMLRQLCEGLASRSVIIEHLPVEWTPELARQDRSAG